jgi:hypothetical protein
LQFLQRGVQEVVGAIVLDLGQLRIIGQQVQGLQDHIRLEVKTKLVRQGIPIQPIVSIQDVRLLHMVEFVETLINVLLSLFLF